MPNQECAKLRAASIECSYSNRRQPRAHSRRIGLSSIVGIRKRDADYPHLLIPHLTVCLLRPIKVSTEAAGAPAERLRLPQSRGNDGNALVSVDLAESTMPSAGQVTGQPPGGHPLKAKIETLQAEPAKLPRVHSRALNRLCRAPECCPCGMLICMSSDTSALPFVHFSDVIDRADDVG